MPLQGVKFPSKNCTNTSGITLCEGQDRLRLWPGQGCGNMGRPPRGDGGGRSSKAAAGRRNWGNVSGKGGWRRLLRAARSEHKGPASNVEPGKGPHCAPLASTFPIYKTRLPASSCAAQTLLLGPLAVSVHQKNGNNPVKEVEPPPESLKAPSLTSCPYQHQLYCSL